MLGVGPRVPGVLDKGFSTELLPRVSFHLRSLCTQFHGNCTMCLLATACSAHHTNISLTAVRGSPTRAVICISVMMADAEGLAVTAPDVYVFGEMSVQTLNPVLNGPISLGLWGFGLAIE